MRCIVLLFCFVLVLVKVRACTNDILVNTADGPILGINETTNSGRTFYSYYSIPYAKPPLGSLRFLAPEPVDPWTEVYNATTEKNILCYQLNADYPMETEDCLFLNVFTPKKPSASKHGRLPVMFNIHGGGFIYGTGHTIYGRTSPKYMMEFDVIFVTINYRLGVFGFLSTGDNVIPGNAGLKDQVLALKWVQRNIAAFGGDPKRVTILGQSAGGASVGYHMLSPKSKGLFAAAISESGSPLCPWAFQRNQTAISFYTAGLVDSQLNMARDSVALLKVLQNTTAQVIDNAQFTYASLNSNRTDGVGLIQIRQGFYFAPTFEVPSNDSFLTEFQYESLEKGNINKVPTLMGITIEEGLRELDGTLDSILQEIDNNLGFLNPQDVHINGPSAWQEVANLIKQEYSPNATFLNNKLGGIQYFTEQDYAKSLVKHAELQSNYTDVYFYQFSFTGTMSGNTRKYPGSGNVTHVEEMNYLYLGQPPELFPESDQLVHKRLVKIWTNFATYHNPTPVQDTLLQNIIWPKVNPKKFQYVNIGNFNETDLVVVQGRPKSKGMAFWDRIYKTYGNRPFDTY